MVKDLAIPPFDERKRLHKRLGQLSREAHEAVDRDREITEIEAHINRLVAPLRRSDIGGADV